jgi:uncharacterized damage-inducible protein DinB
MHDRALIELLRGKGSHVEPLASLAGLPPDLANRRVPPFPHTIGQLVGHMSFWMRYELQRIRGTPSPYPGDAAESWPETREEANASDWDAEVREFGRLLAELEAFAREDPGALEREIPPTDPSHAAIDATLRGILWQTAVHNSYHVGQVALLRRALGSWPPPAGSDTW